MRTAYLRFGTSPEVLNAASAAWTPEGGLAIRGPLLGGKLVALAAPVEQLQQPAHQLGGPTLVGQHVHVALGCEAGHQEGLLLRVLPDAAGAVARAEAGG